MRQQYLHLSAYACARCNGPVVAGSLAIRENEISKETDIRHVGAICLTCGHRQSKGTGACVIRDFSPVQWEPMKASHISPAFDEWSIVYHDDHLSDPGTDTPTQLSSD